MSETKETGDEQIGRGNTASVSRLLLSGGAWSLASRFGQSFIMLAGTMALARLLAPADFGVIAISTTLCVLMLVIAEGFIDFPLLRSDDLTGNQLQSLVWSGLALMSFLALINVIAAPLVEQAFGFAGLSDVIRLSGLIFITQALMVAGRALLRREHRFRETGAFVIIAAAIYVVTSIALALLDFGVWSLAIGQVVSSASLAAMFVRASGLSLRFPRQYDLSGVLRTGSMGLVARVLAWFWANIDTIAVGLATSAASAGFYSRAYNLSTQIKEPFASLDHPVRQALTVSRGQSLNYETVFRETSRLILILATQASVAVALMSGALVALILGSQWAAAAPVLAILAMGIPARIANNLLDGDAVVEGDMARMVTRHVLLSITIGIGACLAANDGIEAVAWVVVVALYLPVFIQVSLGSGFAGTWRSISVIMPALISGAATYVFFVTLQPLAGGNVILEIAVLSLIILCVAILFVLATCPAFRRFAAQKARPPKLNQ